jgi:multidrug efflux pump subunit AcrA (membrane-fusion protein)
VYARIRKLRARSVTAIVAVVVVAGAGATAAFASTSSGGHAYRTAVVTTGSVARELDGSGTIEPVAQASVAFPIAGTVTAVDVTVGARVDVGEKLATLDATALEQDVIDKQAALAAANLKLYQALNGASTSGTGTSTSRSATANSSTSDAQRQILAAQQRVDAALAAAQTALANASSACSVPISTPTKPTTSPARPVGGSGSGGSSTSSTTTSTSTPTTVTGTKPATGGLGSAACITAEQRLLTAQQALSSEQQTLSGAEQAFERASSSTATATPASASAPGANSPSASSLGASSSSTGVSAAQLVAYQSAVDAAATAVLAAQEAVAQATVTSPIAGTIAAVSLQVGKAVAAASTTATVVVVGAGGYEVATTVGVNDITKLKVGDTASVVPDGSNQTLTGKVVWVGAPTGTSSSTTYPVVIGLGASPATLRSGTLASTAIEVARAPVSALTVPTSAVRTANGAHLVTVLTNGNTSIVAVQIGVVGAETTQITSGLRAGQVVVLADLHAAVPSSNTNSRIVNAITGGGTGGGALTGGGLGR